jgi:hypothetical protein
MIRKLTYNFFYPVFSIILTLVLLGLFFVAFFTYFVSAQSSPDAIAIRVIPNPNGYSPLRWYQDQGFSGSPQSLIVDGYEAIRDGRTVYVNAANVIDTDSDGTPDQLYTNIYLIAYNQDAEKATVDIFGRILKHWKFNTNIAGSGNCFGGKQAAVTTSDCAGAVGCWHFENDFSDSSGNGNDVTENGGVIFDNGVLGQAASFDGNDDWLSKIGPNGFPTSATDGSWSFWIKPVGCSNSGILTTNSSQENFNYRGMRIKCDVSTVTNSSILTYGIGWGFDRDINVPYLLNRWSFVVLTRTSSGEWNFYLNGNLIDGPFIDTYNWQQNNLNIGRFNYGTPAWNYFHGLIDEVKIFDRVLSPGEISKEYNSVFHKCLTDADCAGDGYCDSFKARIARDVIRLADFKDMEFYLSQYFSANGRYPVLGSGTYLTNKTVSVWPSWGDNLSKELSAVLPVDPINTLGSCAGYDPVTCWDRLARNVMTETMWMTMNAIIIA